MSSLEDYTSRYTGCLQEQKLGVCSLELEGKQHIMSPIVPQNCEPCNSSASSDNK